MERGIIERIAGDNDPQYVATSPRVYVKVERGMFPMNVSSLLTGPMLEKPGNISQRSAGWSPDLSVSIDH